MNFFFHKFKMVFIVTVFCTVFTIRSYGQNANRQWTIGALERRDKELTAFILNANIHQNIMPAVQESNMIKVEIMKLRLYHLQNNVPNEQDNPYLTRHKFLVMLNRAASAQDFSNLYQLLQQEWLSLTYVSGGQLYMYRGACQNCIFQYKKEVLDATLKLSPSERRLFQNNFSQYLNQQAQTANALNVIAGGTSQSTGFQTKTNTSSSRFQKQPVRRSQGYCSIHQCSYTYGIGMGGGCPKCNTAKYGLTNYVTCPRCHQQYDPTFGHPKCR